MKVNYLIYLNYLAYFCTATISHSIPPPQSGTNTGLRLSLTGFLELFGGFQID